MLAFSSSITDINVSPETWQEVVAENERLRAELAKSQSEAKQLRTLLEETLAEKVRLQRQLNEAQETIVRLDTEKKRLDEAVKEFKQAPFKSRPGSRTKGTSSDPKRRGRPVGHKGSGRKRPSRVDYTEFISVGDHCPDCDRPFSSAGIERERIIEDIEPRRPTIVTRYLIERRWCAGCGQYKENSVIAALPKHRLGLQVMLFVVYQKIALGLSYRKIKHELGTYFGLHLSPASLVNMVAEVGHMFGPAYARLIQVMRQQAALHIDETSWPVDGKRYWLWIFINDVVALYVVSRSRGSKVPKALLGFDFEGVVISDFFQRLFPSEG